MQLWKRFYSYGGVLMLTAASNVFAEAPLWYNGNYAGGSGTVNEVGSVLANLYDDFTVTDSQGWLVQRLWSDNLMRYQGVTSASWCIRTGMSAGNGGTVVASGIAAATQTPTGRTAWWGFPEYTIAVSGLNLYLNPGTYWLSVSPLVGNDAPSSGYWSSYISQTWGANAVGAPLGNDGNSFKYYPAAGYYFAPDEFNEDWSMGIAGTVVPEPTTWLWTLGCISVLVSRRRQCRSAQPDGCRQRRDDLLVPCRPVSGAPRLRRVVGRSPSSL